MRREARRRSLEIGKEQECSICHEKADHGTVITLTTSAYAIHIVPVERNVFVCWACAYAIKSA